MDMRSNQLIIDLQEEITELKRERDAYREKLTKLRLEYVDLETRYEASECERRDERRTATQQAKFTERDDVSQDMTTTRNPTNPRNDIGKNPPEPRSNSELVMRRAVDVIDVDMDDNPDSEV